MRGDGLVEFGAVEHGEVGAFAGGGRQVGGVAEQGDARESVPPVVARYSVLQGELPVVVMDVATLPGSYVNMMIASSSLTAST
ncbi:hypothetical protein ACQP2U_09770 [Nocardia sp. CA-084685]|uniref:hypothetical protein n=1 Tax=Nocardia sp. CA-084685 TaxID=3239970 RepID=UPI003D99BDB5